MLTTIKIKLSLFHMVLRSPFIVTLEKVDSTQNQLSTNNVTYFYHEWQLDGHYPGFLRHFFLLVLHLCISREEEGKYSKVDEQLITMKKGFFTFWKNFGVKLLLVVCLLFENWYHCEILYFKSYVIGKCFQMQTNSPHQ